jgi:hypothetical protein
VYADRVVTCCFLWITSVSHLHVLINILIISFKLLEIKPVPFQKKNKVPSFFVGTIYFNKFSANAFLLVFFPKFWWLWNVTFFRIQRFDTHKRRNEESLHISKGKIIFVFIVFTFSMNLSEIWNTMRVIWINLLYIVIILKEFKCISRNDCSCINVIQFDFRWSRADGTLYVVLLNIHSFPGSKKHEDG